MLMCSGGADSAQMLMQRLVIMAGAEYITLTATAWKPEEIKGFTVPAFPAWEQGQQPLHPLLSVAHPLGAGGTNKAAARRDTEHQQHGMSQKQRHFLAVRASPSSSKSPWKG